MNVKIDIKNLQKKFHEENVFGDFDLQIEIGRTTAIVGPNGSGKSTLLNILSGLIKSDSGKFKIVNFEREKFSYIFQNYRESLFPWKNNFENVIFPRVVQKKNKVEVQHKVEQLQSLIGFEFNWKKYPYQLSGGEQQMLVFFRALITEPNLLFLDEPFSALDYENNLQLRQAFQKYIQIYHPTVILITHDIEEVVHLSDNIIIFSKKPNS